MYLLHSLQIFVIDVLYYVNCKNSFNFQSVLFLCPSLCVLSVESITVEIMPLIS